MGKIKVVQIGLGPLGQKIVQYAVEREGIEIIGAVDPAPDKAGRQLSELCSLENNPGITIAPDISSVLEKDKPDVAILTTVSSLEKLFPQIEEVGGYGVDIISTCEELSFPWIAQPELATRIDKFARGKGVSILGTGVNPGFLMDFLPVVLTGVCQRVESIKVSRIQDAAHRRIPFRKKIGAGLTLEQFEEKRKTGALRHVGLTESIHMIAGRMGWRLEKVTETLEPVVAEAVINAGCMEIQPGMATGVRQVGRGYLKNKEVITLYFRASVGEKNPADTIEIKGLPELTFTVPGGVNGDIATCAITVNGVKQIAEALPGLKTMVDIPPVSFFTGQ